MTEEELYNKELQDDLDKWHLDLAKLQKSEEYINAISKFSELYKGIIDLLVDAKTPKDISSYIWNSGAIDTVLDKIREKIEALELQKKLLEVDED